MVCKPLLWVLQLDGAPPHFHEDVRASLNANVGLDSSQLFSSSWPLGPHSPYLNRCNFFFWGYVTDRTFVFLPLLRDLLQVVQNIFAHAVAAIERTRWNVCGKNWFQNWCLPQHHGYISRTPVRYVHNLESFLMFNSLLW